MDKSHAQPPLDPSLEAPTKGANDSPPPQDPQYDPQNLKALLRNATDKALVWLSNATNEQLGACLVGLGASTYLVFGRVGLVLIGVVGGVVLHATWEGSNGNGAAGEAGLKELSRRREVGIDVAQRVLDWREKRSAEAAGQDATDPLGLGITEQSKAVDFSEFKPETAAALEAFTDAVIRDYVKYVALPVITTDQDD